jgi:hypothetical protein
MVKRIKILLFALIIIFAIVFLMNRARSPKWAIKDILRGYKGVISNIYYKKCFHFEIVNDKNEKLDITDNNGPFSKIAEIGDTLYKKPEENYVYLLKKDGKIYMGTAVFIEPYYRNSSEWPEEWKKKWPQDIPLKMVEKVE